ncbi:hypothetical protein ACWEN6_25000 [Sphaerisporangium sp. NPDC004334]
MRLRGRARAERELEAACDDEFDQLQAAKDAHTEEPTEDSRAAKKQAMASYAETRRWLRAIDAIAKAERDGDGERLAQLQRDHGPLIAAMEALSGTTVSGQPSADPVPEGSVAVTPPTIRARARASRGGS